MLKLGSLTLGAGPCVAIAIQNTVPVDTIRGAADRRTLIELRLDALGDTSPETLAEFTRTYQEFPLLATIRHAGEGGQWTGSESERLAAYQAVLPLVHAVDVEIESGDIGGDVADLAREHGRLSIGSFHDFSETPSSEQLEGIHQHGRDIGFDIVKVAARCNTPADLRRLAQFTLTHESEHVITVGMGAHGLVSRVFFPFLGSLLTYTFLGDPTAPGQLNCTDTLKYLDVFDPTSR